MEMCECKMCDGRVLVTQRTVHRHAELYGRRSADESGSDSSGDYSIHSEQIYRNSDNFIENEMENGSSRDDDSPSSSDVSSDSDQGDLTDDGGDFGTGGEEDDDDDLWLKIQHAEDPAVAWVCKLCREVITWKVIHGDLSYAAALKIFTFMRTMLDGVVDARWLSLLPHTWSQVWARYGDVQLSDFR